MFVGRESLRSELSKLFRAGPTNVSLFGAPGIGKSSLAEVLAKEVCADALWIDAHDADEEALVAQLSGRLACDPSAITEELRGRVVVFDDASPEVLPVLHRWHRQGVSLIATHRRRGDSLGVAREVPPLSLEESIEVLAARLREEGAGEAASDTLRRIASALDGHALSLTVAAGLLTVMTPDELRARLVNYDPKSGLSDRVEDLLGATVERLSEESRLALVDLSTFHRAFSAEDAQRIIDAPEGGALDLVVQLRNEAFVTRAAAGMRLLTPIRMFVRRMALKDPVLTTRRNAAKERHYEHFVAKACGDKEALSKQFVDVRNALLRETEDPKRVLAIANQGPVFARTTSASSVLETLPLGLVERLVGSLDEERRYAGAWAILLRAEAQQRLGGDFEEELARLPTVPEQRPFVVRLNMLRAIAASASGDPLGILSSVTEESTFRERIARSEALRMVGRHVEALRQLSALREVARTRQDHRLVCQYEARAQSDVGDDAGAQANLEAALASAREDRLAYSTAVLQLDQAMMAIDAEDFAGARALIDEAEVAFVKKDDRTLAAVSRFLRAGMTSEELTPAHRETVQGVVRSDLPVPYMRAYGAALLGVDAAAAGDAEASDAYFAEAREIAEDVLAPQYILAVHAEAVNAALMLGRTPEWSGACQPAALGHDCYVPVRFALRRRARLGLDAPSGGVLTIERRGTFAEWNERVDFPAGRPQSNLLAGLALYAWAAPGMTVSFERLIRLGWPDEHVAAKGMRNRLRVTISALRKRGLGDILVTKSGGYGLEAVVKIVDA